MGPMKSRARGPVERRAGACRGQSAGPVPALGHLGPLAVLEFRMCASLGNGLAQPVRKSHCSHLSSVGQRLLWDISQLREPFTPPAAALPVRDLPLCE